MANELIVPTLPTATSQTSSPITELMALDPLSLTRDDPRLIAVIDEYRRSRQLFVQQGDKKAGKAPKPKALTGPAPKISLDDLGL